MRRRRCATARRHAPRKAQGRIDECGRWRAYLGIDKDLDEPAAVVILCPRCAEREFGDG